MVSKTPPFHSYKGGIIDPDCNPVGLPDHCLVLVGYGTGKLQQLNPLAQLSASISEVV